MVVDNVLKLRSVSAEDVMWWEVNTVHLGSHDANCDCQLIPPWQAQGLLYAIEMHSCKSNASVAMQIALNIGSEWIPTVFLVTATHVT